MTSVIIVAIVFGSIVTVAGLLCGTILVIIRLRRSGTSASDRNEEAQMIQEIYRGLEQMEERIEALETILHDTQEKHGDTK